MLGCYYVYVYKSWYTGNKKKLMNNSSDIYFDLQIGLLDVCSLVDDRHFDPIPILFPPAVGLFMKAMFSVV